MKIQRYAWAPAALVVVLALVRTASGDGACCLPGEACVPAADESDCAGFGGVFLDGLDCADAPCGVGACCNDLFCIQADAFNCVTSGRDFIGAGLDCIDDPCGAGIGACCLGGACETVPESTCLSSGGIWLGSGANCTLDPCVPGACCTPGDCQDAVIFQCNSIGGIFVEGNACADEGCEIEDACPGDSLDGLPPDGPDLFTAYTSEQAAGFIRYEDFSGVTGSIERLRWWGLDLVLAGGDPVECEDPAFQVTFHADQAGQPGPPVCAYTLTATVLPTGILYQGAELNRYDVVLPEPCVLVNGWVSIVGVGDANCWFLWMSSTGGNDLHWCDGCSAEQQGEDLAVCLLGTFGDVFGACCNLSTGECADDVAIADCAGPGQRFELDGTCDDLDPPCAIAAGACCFTDGTGCFVNTPRSCIDAGGAWLGPDTDCSLCAIFGACCLGDDCVLLAEDDCLDAGYAWAGPGTECDNCPSVPTCSADSLFGQDPDGPNDFNAGTSEGPFKRYEDFNGVLGPIDGLTWWGVDLFFNPDTNQFEECEDLDTEFTIEFHTDAGGQPGDLVCAATVTATRTEVGLNYLGTPLLEYTAALPVPCELANGWISIAGGGDPDCWFIWMSAGPGMSYCDGCSDQFPGDDLAVCLEGAVGGIFGACCNNVTGDCVDDVEIIDCAGPADRFEPNALCADLDPACGVIVGACCQDDGSCALTDEPSCTTGGGVWLGANTTCNQCPCTVGCPPNAIAEGEAPCFDGYIDEYNGGCTSEAEATIPIALGDTICGTSGVFFDGANNIPDFDWYELLQLEPTTLEWTVTASFPAQAWILQSTGFCPGLVLATEAHTACDTFTISAEVTPGFYWFVVAPIGFNDASVCPAPYTATLGPVRDACPADVNGDFTVDVQDLTAVILAWGTADPAADVNADGVVDVQDLTDVILAWGPCAVPATASPIPGAALARRAAFKPWSDDEAPRATTDALGTPPASAARKTTRR